MDIVIDLPNIQVLRNFAEFVCVVSDGDVARRKRRRTGLDLLADHHRQQSYRQKKRTLLVRPKGQGHRSKY